MSSDTWPHRRRDAGEDRETTIEPHVGRIDFDSEVIPTVELDAKDRQVDLSLIDLGLREVGVSIRKGLPEFR